MASRQEKCKCGEDVGSLLDNIRILEGNLRDIKIENSSTYIPAFEGSINSIYSNIRKVEDSCGIDAREEQNDCSIVSNKVNDMRFAKDQTKFDNIRGGILTDLSKIRYGTMEKVKRCST